MEAIGTASAILSIATAGIQCSVKLATFASQVKTAPERITSVAEDVSLNASILQQLGELAKENIGNAPTLSNNPDMTKIDDEKVDSTAKGCDNDSTQSSIFSAAGLSTVLKLAEKCREIFDSLNGCLQKASKQLTTRSSRLNQVKLNRAEMLKWPFLKPEMDAMCEQLRDAKGTLMLMLQVAMLAYSRKIMKGAEKSSQDKSTLVAYSKEDQELLIRSIVAAQKNVHLPEGTLTSSAETAKNTSSEPVDGNERIRETDASAPDTHGRTGESNINSRHIDLSSNCDTPDSLGKVCHDSNNNFQFSPAYLKVYSLIPEASIRNSHVHISYCSHVYTLQFSRAESQIREWKDSSQSTVLTQLLALRAEEHTALDAINPPRYSYVEKTNDEILEWIQLGEYMPVCEGIEQIKARKMTVFMRLPLSHYSARNATRVSPLIPRSSPFYYKVYSFIPEASVQNSHVQISYCSRVHTLLSSRAECQIQKWKDSSQSTVLTQLLALRAEEHTALDAINSHRGNNSRKAKQEILEWIQLSEYQPVCEGIGQIKARKMTVFMRLVPSRSFSAQGERFRYDAPFKPARFPEASSEPTPAMEIIGRTSATSNGYPPPGNRSSVYNDTYPATDYRRRSVAYRDEIFESESEQDENDRGLEEIGDETGSESEDAGGLEVSEDGSGLEQEEDKSRSKPEEDMIVEELLARYTV